MPSLGACRNGGNVFGTVKTECLRKTECRMPMLEANIANSIHNLVLVRRKVNYLASIRSSRRKLSKTWSQSQNLLPCRV